MTHPTTQPEQEDWEKRFDEQFCENSDKERVGYYILDEVRGTDIKAFIATERTRLLSEVRELVVREKADSDDFFGDTLKQNTHNNALNDLLSALTQLERKA